MWKTIDAHPGYEVSDAGEVRNAKTGLVLKPHMSNAGYLRVTLCEKNKLKKLSVHRAVAGAFIENPGGLPEVNHLDENRLNNSVENLEWCDRKHNINHGTRTSRAANSKKRPVEALLNGAVMFRFSSQTDAARKLGLSKGNINSALRGQPGRPRCGGYEWRYA